MAEIKKTKIPAKKTAAGGNDLDVIELPPQIDISSVSAFFNKVKETYLGKSINFNASKVERITTPAVQVLVSAAVTAKIRGGDFTISEPSEVFKTVMSELGFSNQLKEWMGSDV